MVADLVALGGGPLENRGIGRDAFAQHEECDLDALFLEDIEQLGGESCMGAVVKRERNVGAIDIARIKTRPLAS